MYKVIIEREALRASRSLPKETQIAIARLMMSLRENPRPPGCKKLTGPLKSLWRLRKGDYRIVYSIDDKNKIIKVEMIKHRRDVYR